MTKILLLLLPLLAVSNPISMEHAKLKPLGKDRQDQCTDHPALRPKTKDRFTTAWTY